MVQPTITGRPSADPELSCQVGDDLLLLVKTFTAMRHRMPRLHPDVEDSAFPLIFALLDGPLRVSTIAERIHSDISTVSRQVSHLVQVGILDKVPDPEDGRAHNVALAEPGHRLLADIRSRRGRMFAELMSQWPQEDVRSFDVLLRRLRTNLTSGFEDYCTAAANNWPVPTGEPSPTTTTDLIRKESM